MAVLRTTLPKKMNQLLPIVRRVRRPLIVADAPPVMVGNVEVVELGNIQQPTSNIEHPMEEPAEAMAGNGGSPGRRATAAGKNPRSAGNRIPAEVQGSKRLAAHGGSRS